jgi:hypothetical protein
MNSEERDEEMLREFLAGDSPLSRLYRRDAQEQPNAQLDAAILAAARRNLAPKSRVAHGPFARHWLVPTSLAAVLVLSVSIVLLTPDPVRQPGLEIDGVADTPAMGRGQEPAGEDRAVKKSSEKRERKALQLENVPASEQPPRPVPATGAGVAEEATAPSASRALATPLAEAPPGPHGMPADTVQADPAAWLRFMESLLKEQNSQAARSNLRAFRARYPDFPLPAALMPLAASLDAERP